MALGYANCGHVCQSFVLGACAPEHPSSPEEHTHLPLRVNLAGEDGTVAKCTPPRILKYMRIIVNCSRIACRNEQRRSSAF